MALSRPNTQTLEENLLRDAKSKQNAGLLAQNAQSKRRAFGEISNLVGPFNSKVGFGKEKAGTLDLARTARNVTTKPSKDADALLRPLLAPRTRSQTRAQGVSLSSLLQSRSEAASAHKAPPSPLPDIDAADRGNPLAATEYVNDIYGYYRRAEAKYRVSPDYMASQTDINERMRAILVDWLVEVHLKFKLMPETLFLTVNLIDRFLEARQVTRKNLQLVGVTAMLISSKYEEIWAPEVRDFVYISDKAYTREQILGMEKQMLNTLGFNLTQPTAFSFMARALKAAGCQFDKQVNMYAGYLAELALVENGMLKHANSHIAAACVYTALRAFGRADAYPRALARHAGYPIEMVRPVAAELVRLAQRASANQLNAVHKKYANAKYLEIAKTEAPGALVDEAEAAGAGAP